MELWTDKTLAVDQTYRARIGPLTLWIRRSNDEIYLAEQRSEESIGPSGQELAPTTESLPSDLPWSRWIVGSKTDSLRLVPRLPDRGCVVRTDAPLKIPPGQRAMFFVSLPIWIGLQVEELSSKPIVEIPTVIRSNTWFGDAMVGELCYSLMSRARRQAEDVDHPIHKAVCPVRIRNRSTDLLEVERICIRVEHLNLYGGRKLLWTNEVTITFQGPDQVSKLVYSNKIPDMEPNLSLQTPARSPIKETLLKRSLGSFKAFTEI